MKHALLSAVTLAIVCAAVAPAQTAFARTASQSAAAQTRPLSRAQVAGALDALAAALDHYAHPHAAARGWAVLRKNRADYLRLTDPEALAARLTRDLGAAMKDRQFAVRADAATTAPSGQDGKRFRLGAGLSVQFVTA